MYIPVTFTQWTGKCFYYLHNNARREGIACIFFSVFLMAPACVQNLLCFESPAQNYKVWKLKGRGDCFSFILV